MTQKVNPAPAPIAAPVDGAGDRAERPTGNLREAGARAMRWQSLSTVILQVLQAVTTLVLAGVVGPREFALWGVAQILLNARVVLTFGFGEALIYFDARARFRDYVDTAFAGTAAVVGITSGALIAFAPHIAGVFGSTFSHDDVVLAIRLTAIAFAFSTIETIPLAVLERRLDFRRRATVEIGTSVFYAILAMGLLAAGAGVWSLIIARVALTFARFVGFWIAAPVRPRPRPAVRRDVLKAMLAYGGFLNGAAILGFAAENLDTVVIGRVGGAAALGAYALAFTVANLVPTFLSSTLARVSMPMYATVRAQRERLQEAFAAAMHFLAAIMAPVSLALAFVVPGALEDILGGNWSHAAPFLRILAVYSLARAIGDAGMSLLSGIGRTKHSMIGRAIGLAVPLAIVLPLNDLDGAEGVAIAFACGRVAVAAYALAAGHEALSGRLARMLKPAAAAVLATAAAVAVRQATGPEIQSYLALATVAVLYPAFLFLLDGWVRANARSLMRGTPVPLETAR